MYPWWLPRVQNFTKDVVIVEKLVDPVIVPDFPKAPVNKALNVTFFLFRGPSAPLANLTWDFGDGLGSQVFGRTGMELGFCLDLPYLCRYLLYGLHWLASLGGRQT